MHPNTLLLRSEPLFVCLFVFYWTTIKLLEVPDLIHSITLHVLAQKLVCTYQCIFSAFVCMLGTKCFKFQTNLIPLSYFRHDLKFWTGIMEIFYQIYVMFSFLSCFVNLSKLMYLLVKLFIAYFDLLWLFCLRLL